MHNPLSVALALIALGSISACSTQLTQKGSKVDLVTASSSDGCILIKMFTVKGSNRDETLRMAFNEAGVLGADSMAVADGKEIATGAEINGVALSCQKRTDDTNGPQ
ncbi:hypothetical protein IMF27_29510 [Pseudomonas sp. PCH199]|uniref:hypothetical protein n=1 Tax=unclassified Pseudomonas TaxID=196821 RepID=UPI0015A76DFB|nr:MULTISPECIES: hypothetical protein [unclassified Pseudomonas]MCW8279115.1 hypothetical protein [Pseudomonas sp. PCH199]